MDGVTTVTDRGVPPDVTWWRTDLYAHAFLEGRSMSLCGRVHRAALLRVSVASDVPCPDCDLLTDGAPGEITEAWGR